METYKEDSDHSRGNFPNLIITEHLLLGQTHWLHLRRYIFQEKHGIFVNNVTVKSSSKYIRGELSGGLLGPIRYR